MGGKVKKIDHLLDTAAMRSFVAADVRQKEQFLPEGRGGVPMTSDQKIAENGGVLEQFDVLEGTRDAEFRDVVRRCSRDVLILEIEFSRGRLIKSRDQVEDRAFPCPVGADDGKDFALLHGKADGIDRFQTAEMQREIFGTETTHRFRSDLT